MLSNRIQELRKAKKISQRKLAKDMNLAPSTIAIEVGKRKPDSDTLQKLASYFNTSVDYLLARTKEPRPADKIKEAISNDPELLAFWDKLLERKDLQLLFKQTKDMTPEGVQQIIRIIQVIEKEEKIVRRIYFKR